MVKHGANVTNCDNNALVMAATNGHLHVVQYLVHLGVNVQAQRNQAVRSAIRANHAYIVKYLFDQGANIPSVKYYLSKNYY